MLLPNCSIAVEEWSLNRSLVCWRGFDYEFAVFFCGKLGGFYISYHLDTISVHKVPRFHLSTLVFLTCIFWRCCLCSPQLLRMPTTGPNMPCIFLFSKPSIKHHLVALGQGNDIMARHRQKGETGVIFCVALMAVFNGNHRIFWCLKTWKMLIFLAPQTEKFWFS